MLAFRTWANGGFVMSGRMCSFALLALLFGDEVARAQTAPAASEAVQAMVGAWEISTSDRDRRCNVTFKAEPAPGGLKVELDPACTTAFPNLKDVVAWNVGQKDTVR